MSQGPQSISGGVKGSGLPSGFEYRTSETTGALELWQGETRIASQHEDGTWLSTSVTTGVGSLHLGDLHSLGSGNENLVAVNNDSEIAWYPAWGGMSLDGWTKHPVTARVHNDTLVASANGNTNYSSSVDYNYTFTASDDRAFFSVALRCAETYSGRLRWRVVRENGLEVSAFNFNVNLVPNSEFEIPFKYPLWTRAGQVFTLTLTKDDGTFLKVRAGDTNPAEPWRSNRTATYADHEVYHKGNRNTAQASHYLGRLESASEEFLSLGRITLKLRNIQSVSSFVQMNSTVSAQVYWSDNFGASGQSSIAQGGGMLWSKVADNNAVRTITFTARNATVGMSQTGIIQLKVDNYGAVDQRVFASGFLTIAD